jgi:uncharacterized membrane protein
VGGVSVALLGLLLYLGVFGAALWRLRDGASTPGAISLALLGLALSGALYSTYLTYLELFVIRAICPWCVSSALLLVALCGLGAWDLAALERQEASAV